MTETAAILEKLLPILLLMLTGFVFRQTGFVTQQVMEGMKKLAVNVTLPVIIFLSLLESELHAAYLPLALSVFLVSCVLLVAGQLLIRWLGWQNKYAGLLFTGYENGMLGYGVFAAVFGQELIYPIVILDLGQTLFFALIFTTYMRSLNHELNEITLKSVGKACLTNPYLLVSAAAILTNVTGLSESIQEQSLGQGILETLQILGGLTTPLMCLAIGYGIRLRKQYLSKALIVIALRLFLLGGIAVLFNCFIIKELLGPDSLFTPAVYTMFMLPPFFVGALLIRPDETESREFAFSVISLHTITFMVLFCLIAPIL